MEAGKQEYGNRVTFHVSDEELAELDALRKAEKRTRSGMLRVLISRAAQNLGKDDAVTNVLAPKGGGR